MADALYAVIAADQKAYALQEGVENLMALHAQRLRQPSESVQQQGAEFKPKRDVKIADVMGGPVVRVPLEF